MSKKNRMKNGLDSLFEDNFAEETVQPAATEEPEKDSSEGLLTVRLSLVEPDRKQPRKNFDEASLSELADNIAKMGVLQPLLVRPAASGRFTIVAGERRWRAARLAGLTELPVICRDFTDEEAAKIALIENIQREDLDPIEEAEAFSRLKTEFHLTQEEIAGTVGRSRAAVANSLRLLELPEEARKALQEKKISVGHAKILCGVEEKAKLLSLMEETVSRGLSVRELERLTSEQAKPADRKPKKKTVFGSADKQLSEYSLSMKNEFGVAADFKKKSNGSTVMSVSFKNDEELAEFFRRLGRK